jgi:hypothetical protein
MENYRIGITDKTLKPYETQLLNPNFSFCQANQKYH